MTFSDHICMKNFERFIHINERFLGKALSDMREKRRKEMKGKGENEREYNDREKKRWKKIK